MDRMNILTATDDNYAPWCGVMLTSLLEHNQGYDIHIWILSDNISEQNKMLLNSLDAAIHIVDLDEVDFSSWVPSLALGEYLSRTTWARLALGDVLPADVHKILHIDADTIVLGSLHELYDTDLTGIAAAAVDEYRDARYLGMHGMYFNAGVILFNVDYFRDNNVRDKCIKYVEEYAGVIRFHDQDVLNKVFEGKVLFMHRKFNMTFCGDVVSDDIRPGEDFSKDMEAVRDGDVRVYHFVGKEKPWYLYLFRPRPFDRCWRQVYRRSAWKKCRLLTKVSSTRDKLTVMIVNLLFKIGVKSPESNKYWVDVYPDSRWNRLKSFFSLDSYR